MLRRFFRSKNRLELFSIAMILLLIMVLMNAGCVSIPKNEIANYNKAISSAREAGEQMTQDWQAAKAEQERREQARIPAPPPEDPAPIPLTWTPPANGSEKLSAEKIRLLAWETIGEYTSILVALNAGESVESVKSSVGRLYDLVDKIATAAGSGIPGGDALVLLFKALGEQLEKARLAEEFKKAIKGGAPKVRQMLKVFRDDAESHYMLRASLAASDYERVDLEDSLSDKEKKIKKARIKASIEAFQKSLQNYVLLINETLKNLKAMEDALDRPINYRSEANHMLDIAITLKQHWVAYQNARSEGN